MEITYLYKAIYYLLRNGELRPIEPPEEYLKIEIQQELLEGGADQAPATFYHLYDSNVPIGLSGNHIVLTTYNESQKFGYMYTIETTPQNFVNNFGLIMSWCPKLIVNAIKQIEIDLSISKPIFSERNDWEINYYGLINELFVKGVAM